MCLVLLEEVLQQEFSNDKFVSLLTTMWAMAGDVISKIYAGTNSVMTSVTLKGKENMLDRIDHRYVSVKRFFKQNLSDDFK